VWTRVFRASWLMIRFAFVAGALWVLASVMVSTTPRPDQEHSASTGTEIWVAPGYSGPVDVYSKPLDSTGGFWEATPQLILKLTGPSGSPEIIGKSTHKQDWGNSVWIDYETVIVAMDVEVPADAALGTDWHGDLSGPIIVGVAYDGHILRRTEEADIEGITLHVVSSEDVARRVNHGDGDRGKWLLIQWGLSPLVLIIGALASVRVLRGQKVIPSLRLRR
jgi:hypothetical protein